MRASARIGSEPEKKSTQRHRDCVSRNAELVSFGILHDHVPERLFVKLLPDDPGASCLQLRHLCPNQSLSLIHVPITITRYADVDVHAVLRGFPFRNLQEPDCRASTVGVNDRCVVPLVEARLLHVAKGERPERRKLLRICRVATQSPVRCHGPSVTSPSSGVNNRESALIRADCHVCRCTCLLRVAPGCVPQQSHSLEGPPP
jgi:hypothetical protein